MQRQQHKGGGNGVLWDKTLPNPAGASAGDSVGRRGVAAKARDKSQCRGPTKLVPILLLCYARGIPYFIPPPPNPANFGGGG